MDKDTLAEATRALRDFAPQSNETAELTRARVLRDLHRGRQLRAKRAVWALPVAAIILGTTAAAAAGGSLEHAFRAVTDFVKITEPTQELRATAGAARSRTEVAARRVDPVAPPSPEPQVATDTPEALAVPSVPASVPVAVPVVDPSEALYREAHAAHFQRRDFGQALSAWERYLAKAPSGRFALEARYNRALCLIRLGRSAEAQQALAPFAEGRFGGYRAAEATKLIEALSASVSPSPAPADAHEP